MAARDVGIGQADVGFFGPSKNEHVSCKGNFFAWIWALLHNKFCHIEHLPFHVPVERLCCRVENQFGVQTSQSNSMRCLWSKHIAARGLLSIWHRNGVFVAKAYA